MTCNCGHAQAHSTDKLKPRQAIEYWVPCRRLNNGSAC